MKTHMTFTHLQRGLALLVLVLLAAAPAFGQLQDAVDNFTLTFGNDPGPANEQWYRVTDVTHDGVDAARSGSSVDHSADSGFSTTVTGPGTISFWWKVSSQDNPDGLAFITEDPGGSYSYEAYIAGNVDWEYREFSIPAGNYTLYWSYMKDYQYSSGSDCGWVDQIVWTPGGAPDTTPPGDVTDFTLTPGDRRVDLSWANPGDADLEGVRIVRKAGLVPTSPTDGDLVYDGTGEEATDYGVDNGTRYYYKAYAYDEVPNYSVGSAVWTHPGERPCCGTAVGYAGRALFEDLQATYGGTYIDFDSFGVGTALNTQLQASDGVTFWTTTTTAGAPLATPHNVRVSGASPASAPNSIVGTPSPGSGDDGRPAYEIRFDEPQRWAGLERTWSTWNANCLTRFYGPSGALLAEVNVNPQRFAGYIACSDDTNDWISVIECNSYTREVGYTDDLFFGTGPADVAPETWRYAYPNPGSDGAYDTAIDSQGDVYVAGAYTDTGDTYHDAVLFKVTPGSNTYDWIVHRNKPGQDWYDRYHALCIDTQNNVIVAGRLGQNSAPYTESVVAKYTPDGSNLWEHVWHKSGGTEAIAFDMDMAPDGTMYAACHVDVSAHDYILWGVLEYAPTGFVGEVASATYDNPATTYTYRNYPSGIAVADDHRMCVVGRSGDSAQTRVDWHVRYHNAAHALLWDDTITTGVSGDSAYAEKADMDTSGNPVVVGYLQTPAGRNDALAVKYDAATGDVLWSNRCSRGTTAVYKDVHVDGAGDVLIVGYCSEAGVARARLLKLDGDTGEILADQLWGGETMDFRSLDAGPYGIACGASSSSDVAVVWMDMPDTLAPQIVLSGNNPLELARGTTYSDPGYTATDDVDGDISGNVSVTGSVDHTTVGTYTLYYNVSDAAGNAATEQMRTVNVVDRAPPSIVLQGDNPFVLEGGTAYTEPGYTATDDVDGDISGNVSVTGSVDHTTVGTHMVYYDVSDAAGNAATQQVRTVNVVDTTPPAITLQGDNPLELERGTAYVEPGYTATDIVDGDVSADVTVTGSVDHTTNGTYTLRYNVMDALSNAAPEQVRTVNVVEPATGPPNAPVLLAPTGTVSATRRPMFDWADTARATWYNLVIEQDGRAYYSTWLQATEWTPTWNLAPGTYTWTVQAWGPDGLGPVSATATFDIPAQVPGKLDLYDPSGTISTNRPAFDWEGDKNAAWYRLIVQRSGTTVIDEWIQGVSEFTPAQGLRYGYYSWYVRGWGLDGLGPWSDKGSFEYGVPEPLTPAHLSDVTAPYRPTFSWEEIDGAAWYNVWILRNHELYHKQWVHMTTEWTPTWDLPPGSYEWYVRAWGPEALMTPWSWEMFFFIGAPVVLEPQGALTGPPTEMVWDDTESSYALWYKVEFFNQDTYVSFSSWVKRTDTSAVGNERTALLPPNVSPLPSGRYLCFMTPWYTGGLGGGSYPIEFIVP